MCYGTVHDAKISEKLIRKCQVLFKRKCQVLFKICSKCYMYPDRHFSRT